MFTPITITWHVVDADGSLASGGVTFQLRDAQGNIATMEDSVTGETVSAGPVTGVVVQGHLLSPAPSNPPLVLLANDDPDTLPVGCYYEVSEELVAGSLQPWHLTVLHDSPGGTLDLSSQRPTPA